MSWNRFILGAAALLSVAAVYASWDRRELKRTLDLSKRNVVVSVEAPRPLACHRSSDCVLGEKPSRGACPSGRRAVFGAAYRRWLAPKMATRGLLYCAPLVPYAPRVVCGEGLRCDRGTCVGRCAP